MKIAITGATGLVGSHFAESMSSRGHEVLRIVRSEARGANDVPWNPDARSIDARALEGIDAAVHLAGENIAAKRWTPAVKARILESRTGSTTLLADALAKLHAQPRVLVSASAVGFYGDRGDEVLDERSPRGGGFLADVCERWEQASEPARTAGIRVVHMRFGVVLCPAGGALRQMLTPFRFGLGGALGSGCQYMSWISLGDLLAAIEHAIATPALDGPVNATSPNPVTNADFTRTLASALHRPALLSVPAFALRAVAGEMADEMLLASTRALPRRLLDSGFDFRDAELGSALARMLRR